MTTMTLLPTAPTLAASTPIRPLRFSTLTAVEMRKMTDTRSGRWLLGMIIGLIGGVLAWKVAHASVEVSTDNYGGATVSILAFFVPVIGLLAMTSEWAQRTALTTFTLAPRRLPVIAAKFVGGDDAVARRTSRRAPHGYRRHRDRWARPWQRQLRGLAHRHPRPSSWRYR